jgi:DNA end-binding protein Ku
MERKSIWKGSVGFGLVNIPIKLHTATRDSKVSFNQITPCCGARVNQALKCATCGREVSRAEVKKGYEVSKGNFVVLEPAEIEAVKLPSTKQITIEGFAPDIIEPILYADHYYISPEQGGEKAYALLCEALSLSAVVGVGTLTIHGKEHIIVVRARGRHLILSLLWYANEVLVPPEVPEGMLTDAERGLAKQLLEAMKVKLDLSKYRNRYVEAVQEVIRAKSEGREISAVEVEAKATMDLSKALQESLIKKRLKPIEVEAR